MKTFFTKTENNASLRQPHSGGIGKKLRATLALPLRHLCATLLLLTLGVGQMWASTWMEEPKITINSEQKAASSVTDDHWGVQTSMEITNFTWYGKRNDKNNDGMWAEGKLHYQVTGPTATSWTDIVESSGTWYDDYHTCHINHNMNLQLCDSRSPGNYEFIFCFAHRTGDDSYVWYNNSNNNYHIYWTIPGFTTTNTSQAFNNTTVSSNSSTTISFGTHYGTTLTTSNCSITGTNASDFSVTAITESGVTVKFTPTATGSRSATLTITDAHSKTCTITLSGTGTAPAETTHSVTVSYVCTSPSATVSTATTPTIGEVTYSEQTAPVVAGYTFSNWTYGDGISVKSGDTNTSNPIHVKTLSSGTYTLTANYTEDLTSTWKIVGQSPSDKTNSPFSSWTYASSTNTMAKATGHSTESVVYATISVPAASVTGDSYEFKVTSDGSTLYGYGTSEGYYILFDETKTNQSVYSNNNSDHALQFKPNVAGDYIFKVDYSGSYPSVSVTFPVSYTVNFGVSPAAAASAPTNNKSISNGGLVLSGTSVTFTHDDASTGYTWSHWDVGGANVGTGETYTTSISANTTVTAVYTENSYATTVSNDGHGSVSPTGTVNISHHTGTELTATPNDHYAFYNWTFANGGIALKSPSVATSNPATFTATSASGTITANFVDRWAIKGSGELGDWSTFNDMPYAGVTNTYKKTLSLAANTTYNFKIADRRGSTMYGASSTTLTRASASKTGLTTENGETYNIKLNTDVAGTYTFTYVYNASEGSMQVSVEYPPFLTWSANSIYTGDATINASVSNIVSGKTLKYELFAGTDTSVSALLTYTNNSTSSTTDSHDFTVTPSFGENEINKVYTIKITYDGTKTAKYTHVVGRKWDIYVHDINSWGGVSLHHWGDYGSSTFPGDACAVYNSPSTWYTVVMDGKYNNGFKLSKTSDATNHQTINLTPSLTTYSAGSYWYISHANDEYNLTTAGTVVAPTVTLTVDKINVNQITVTGTITDCGNDGTTAADMKEVGFYLGETKYTATYKSGTSFKMTITSLIANNTYSVKAFATNIIGTGESAAQSITTLEDADYTIKVRVPRGATAPKVYAWTDADSYGGSKMENGSYGSQSAATLLFAATTYDWYYCDINNKYEKFLIYYTGDTDKSEDFAATRTSDCYWYEPSNNPKAEKMDCPLFGTHLVIKKQGDVEDTRLEMTGSEGIVSYTYNNLPAGTHQLKVMYNTEYYGREADNSNSISREGVTTANYVDDLAVNGGYIQLNAVLAGDYTFTFQASANNKLSATFPEAYVVTYSASTVGTGDGNSGAPSAAVTVSERAVTSGTYVQKDTSVTFTAAAANENYTFIGWYGDNTGSTSRLSDEDAMTYTTTISAATTVYAVYSENKSAITINEGVHGTVTGSGEYQLGVYTKQAISAEPAAGYYFAGWEVTGNAVVEDASSASTNVKNNGTAGGTGTVTANFVELDKVYFRNWNVDANAPLWDNVYVYFSIYYEKDGNNQDCAKSNISADYYTQMTREGTSNVYWAHIPRGTTIGGDDDIAFSNHDFGTNYKFNSDEAVMRGDYRKGLDMFVPQHSSSYSRNGTTYYNGYWKHHNVATNTDAGYSIVRYKGGDGSEKYEDPANNGGDRRKFFVAGENAIQYKLRIDNTGNDHNNYMIYSLGEIHYITFDSSPSETGYTITNSNYSNIALSEYNSGSPRFYITPTTEGLYTLTIDMSGDVMRLSVNYPVAVGDYQLIHTYNNDGAKTSRSDIIKTSEVGERKYSMYIDSVHAHSPSLILKKCTAITDGNPVWSAGNDVSMANFGTAGNFHKDTTGVFVFNVSITSDNATLSNVKAYTGSYYIKTDYAPGGWTNYKENSMNHNTINFDKADSKTFDYYYCKWVSTDEYGGQRNVKCVIANDYNEQVTDTLIGDNILGEYNNQQRQYLAYDANVRFSYNSITNELKRAYINGATDWQETFLRISAGDANQIRSKYTHTAFAGNDTTFTDNNNWIYQLDLEAKPGARVKVTANYRFSDDDHEQYFIGQPGDYSVPNTEQILGGSTNEWLGFRIIYDFKTNKLIAAYLPQDMEVTSNKPIEADIMFIRNHHEDAGQLTFSTGKKLTEVKTAYGVMEFDKTTIFNDSKTEAERALYWISFPFDVNAKKIFGMGEYGKQWILEYYDGEARAREGQWVDSPTRWTFVMPAMRDTLVLRKGMGYVLALDLDEMKNDGLWVNGVTSVHLYFPSASDINTIDGTLESITIPAHTCNITRNNRNIWDRDWNVIGVPTYRNISGLDYTENSEDAATTAASNTGITAPGELSFYYAFDAATNSFNVQKANTSATKFRTMYSYLVQYAGTLDWANNKESSSVAARRVATDEEKDKWTLDLHIAQEGTDADHTYIEFRDDVTDAYDMNNDLVKNANGNQTIVYTLLERAYMSDPDATVPVRMGANCLAVPAADKTVAVGLIANKAGEYTFSMPEGTDGMDVTLIDYELNSETNLSLGDYTAVLEKGTCDNRFALRINRRNVVTSLEGCNGSELRSAEAEKVMINGNLYIRQNGHSYDAQGKRVE